MPVQNQKLSAVKKQVAVPTDAILYTVAEAAKLLRLSQGCIRWWILQRKIPFVKLGGAVRIRRTDIDALILNGLMPVRKAGV